MNKLFAFLFLMGSVFTLVTSCNEDDDQPAVTPTTTEDVQLRNDATLGSILTDASGRTLYFFSNDSKTTSNCSGDCLVNWPLFHESDLTVAEGLNAADFGTITRSDGEMQTTYQGWPLYYFVNDNAAGETNGEGVADIWFVAKPDYSLMLVNSQLVGHDGKNYTDDYEEGEGLSLYITDIAGNTLYAFINDTRNTNNFTQSDFSNNSVWPIAEISLDQIPSTLDRSDFGQIDVFGRSQLTYKGWPLYYFFQDEARGDNKGISFPEPGIWPVVNQQTPEAPEAPAATNVSLVMNDSLGQVMVDQEGMTLYFFSNDSKGVSECFDGCLDAWPVFYEESLMLGDGLDAADFGEITRPDGTKQSTYLGWPLYYFANDSEAGDVNGEGVGNIWFVSKPDYSLMKVNAQLIGADGNNYKSDYTEGDELTMYITDIQGRTLYRFVNDTENTNNYTMEDFSNDAVWPIVEIELDQIPSILNNADFGTINVFGRNQLTFKGWPLYYFGSDTARGDNKGVSVPNPGIWPIANNQTPSASN